MCKIWYALAGSHCSLQGTAIYFLKDAGRQNLQCDYTN